MVRKLLIALLLCTGPAAFADIGNRDYGDALFLGMWTYITFLFSCITAPCILLYLLAAWRSRLPRVLLFLYALLPAAVYGIFFSFLHDYRQRYDRPDAATQTGYNPLAFWVIGAGFVIHVFFLYQQCSKPKKK